MIDTVKLSMTDFEIDLHKLKKASDIEGCSFGIKQRTLTTEEAIQGRNELSDFLFYDRSGIPCFGEKAFYNSETCNVDIYNGLSVVQFSAPKVVTGNNYYTSSKAETQLALQQVESYLSENGIHCNLQDSNVIRLDLTQTAETDFPFKTYMPVLQLLEGKRAKDKRAFQAQTMLFGNSSIQACCYDKIAEMKTHKLETAMYPENSFRAELRLLNKRKVQSSLHLESAKEVINHWAEVKDQRQSLLKDFLFKTAPEDFNGMLASSVEKMLQAYCSTDKRNWFNTMLKDFGLLTLLKAVETETIIKLYREELERKGMERRVVSASTSRLRRQIQKSLSGVMESLEVETIPYRQLYTELYNKVVNAA